MPMGEFTVGRSAACNLALSDGLVSRRHAVLHVRPDAVVVEDLGSRNGVAVNGVRVDGPRALTHLDRVYIGSQELVLIDTEKMREGAKGTEDYRQCENCGAINGSAKRRCGECGQMLGSAATGTADVLDPPREQQPLEVVEVTRKARAIDVIGGIASKAIAMGRYEEAERMLLPHLDAFLGHAELGRPINGETPESDGELLDRATAFALQLADGLNNNRWIDWVFRIHLATGRLMQQETIETLHSLVRKNRYSRVQPLRKYLGAMQGDGTQHNASERFLVRRLRGLENVIAAS